MKKLHGYLLSAIFALNVSPADAVIYEFKDKAAAVHYFDNPAEYGNGMPTEGGWVQLAELAYGSTPDEKRSSTVYVTNDWTVPLNYVVLKGGTRTADDRKAEIRFLASPQGQNEHVDFAPGDFPDGSSAQYGQNPFEFVGYNNGDHVIARVAAGKNPDLSVAKYKFTDFDVTVGVDAGDFYLRFDKGVFNFYDPSGVTNSVSEFALGYTPASIGFSSDVVLRLPLMKIVPAAGTSPVGFSGTVVDALIGYQQEAGNVSIANAAKFRTAEFEILGGALSVAGGSSLTNDGQLVVSEGGSMAVSGADTSVKVKGAVVKSTGEASVLTIDGGTFDSAGEVAVNNNAGIVVNGGNVYLQKASGNNVTIGWNTKNSLIRINGGYVETYRVRQGRYSKEGSSSTVEVNGGEFKIANHYNFHQDDSTAGGVHDLILNGGVMKVPLFNRYNSLTSVESTTARIIGDGGRLQVMASHPSATDPYIHSVAHLLCGDSGFTLDTQSYKTYLAFPFEDKEGESGVFVKEGAGELVYAPATATSVSKMKVSAGTFTYARDDVASDTEIEVSSGAVFSMIGDAAELKFKSFSAENATVKADAGDRIVVDGVENLRISGLKVENALGESLSPSDVFVIGGTVDEASEKELMRMFAVQCEDDEHLVYEFVYDETADATSVAVTKAADIVYSDNAVWSGGKSGDWSDAENWTDAFKPAATANAVFGSGAAEKSVTVGQDEVGAVMFGSDGYTLGGEASLSFSDGGGAEISAAEDVSATIDVPVVYPGKLTADVAAGGEIVLNGGVSGGLLRKTGTGRLVISGSNDSVLGTVLADGMTVITSAGGAGTAKDRTVLKAGTLVYDCDEPLTVASSLLIEADDSTGYAAVKTDCDVTIGSIAVRNGAFMKRGAGKLTVEVSGTAENPTVLSAGGGNVSEAAKIVPYAGGLEFPEDGTAPVPDAYGRGLYPAFGIAEGEVELKGVVDDPVVKMEGWGVVGMPIRSEPASRPVLTVNGVTLETCRDKGWEMFMIGCATGSNGVGVQDPTLKIINGGYVKDVTRSQIGYATGDNGRIWVVATNGVFEIEERTYITRAYLYGAKVFYRFKDSALKSSGKLYVGGGIDLVFDNSFFGLSGGEAVSLVGESDRPNGSMLFRNKSVFAYAGFDDASMTKRLVIAMDDSEWRPSIARTNAVLAASVSGKLRYEVQGTGVVMKPAAGNTYTINATIEGDGGIVVDGEGSVVFGSGTFAFTGVCDVRGGAVDLSAAGEVSARIKGSGSVVGGNFSSLTVISGIDDSGNVSASPTFGGCAFPSRVTVDFGRDAENPVPALFTGLEVARFTGSAPDVSGWNLAGTGSDDEPGPSGFKVGGKFRVEGNAVVVDLVAKGGFTVLVR